MKKIAIAICLLITCISWGQKTAGKSSKAEADEWDMLDKTFVALIDALVKNDKAAFKAVSYPAVDCIDCVGKPDFNQEGYFVTADVFYLNIANNFINSPVYKALAKRGYTFSITEIKDFKPKILPKDYPKDLKLYEVWVPTYLKGELSSNHPGTSHAFQFIQVKGEYRFYGLTSIP